MNIFQSIILGIVQGLTEFLPVSSTAHLRIIPALLNWEDPGTAYSAVIQLGTVFAVVVYFFSDLKKIYGSFFSDVPRFFKNEKPRLKSFEAKLGFWILFSTLPICFFGLLFKDPIEMGFVRSLNVVSFFLIFVSLLMVLAEKIGKQEKTLHKINFLDALWIGFAQSLALIPGVSRSGSTITAALFLGLKREDAARFSFLLSVPAVVLSGLLELKTFILSVKSGEELIWMNIIVGVVSAFLSGYFSIDFLLKYLKTHKIYVFVIYRVLLGLLVVYLNWKGVIN